MPSPVPCACTKDFHGSSWVGLSCNRLFRRTAATICSTHSFWSTLILSPWASFQSSSFLCFMQRPTQRKFWIPWGRTVSCLSEICLISWQQINKTSWSSSPAMKSFSCLPPFSCSSVAKEVCCCLSFTTDSSLFATHPEETHIAAPCSLSCGSSWSTLPWSPPALSFSDGCASAALPSSAAWHPPGSEPFPLHLPFVPTGLYYNRSRWYSKQKELFSECHFVLQLFEKFMSPSRPANNALNHGRILFVFVLFFLIVTLFKKWTSFCLKMKTFVCSAIFPCPYLFIMSYQLGDNNINEMYKHVNIFLLSEHTWFDGGGWKLCAVYTYFFLIFHVYLEFFLMPLMSYVNLY